MSIVEIVTLFTVMVALALIPSTSVALVVARASMAGFLSGAAVAAGIVVGDLIFVICAVLGMAALAEVMGELFLIMRYLAGIYLIGLGINLINSKPLLPAKSPSSTLSASFLSGLIVTLADVKAIFFYASLFPAFVDLTTVSLSEILILIALTIVAVGGVKLGYAYSANKLASLFTNTKTQRTFKLAAGSLMAGIGAYLLIKA
ncbi:LysE family translocator [Dasania sp. GY-MA-18]|uniref:LysE family translocator n=1 Tax=Dasania phycosphaerae TaxID=2950436 RepID=A0A9J6RJ93_9GAMM|nr:MULTISPECIES: LysE family translocator [Dasania]MCR8921609.1 LysE family translocator [Dasania sp. GY-MA-18]MCZ0864037.1 LysE family translocator [Dasania phycosphaerae]MCZ0867765.1 LysE family translocator [Dasania phycosphaerae]